MRFACWINKATNTHKFRIVNTDCFSTGTVLARTRLVVTLYVHCPPFSLNASFYLCHSTNASYLSLTTFCSYQKNKWQRLETFKDSKVFFQTSGCIQH